MKEWLQYRSLEEEQEQEDALCSNDSSTCKDQDLPRRKRGPTGAASRDAEEEEESDEESNEDDSNDGDEEGNGEEESSQPHGTPYDRDPALGELLQFLLSLPYVDEAWGVQDLILVRYEKSTVL